jgi:hypothetical protein
VKTGGVRTSALAVVCTVALLLPASAGAHSEAPQEFTMKVLEGETTVPENQIAGVSASANHNPQLRLRLIHGGTVAAEDTYEPAEGGYAGVGFSLLPVPGDVVELESPFGNVVGAITYDGLPSMDSTVCVGSTNFSGQRSGGESVEGRFFSEQPRLDRYGRPIPHEWTRAGEGFAQVTSLVGSAFGGNFLAPVPAGATVTAKESVEVPIAGGAIFTYESESVRPAAACPAPPPPPPPPPAPLFPTLRASIAKLLFGKLGSILRKGLHDEVYVDEPGIVVQDLYLAGGALPAHATRRHRTRPALLLARGTANASRAGNVFVTLHPTRRGRPHLLHAHRLGVVLITTVHGDNGKTITLTARHVTLRR